MTKLVIVDRKTNKEGYAVRTEEGKFEVFVGDFSRVYSPSTFKKYYKLTGETLGATNNEEDNVEESKVEEENTQMVKEVNSDKREKMIETVRKLLSLSENNPSQEEAIAASLKAQELMSKYRIEQVELGVKMTEEIIESEVIARGKSRKWKGHLAMAIATNFRCEVYRSSSNESNYTFYGYEGDVKVATEVFTSLFNSCYKLLRQEERRARKSTGSAAGISNSFTLGFIAGVKSELEKQSTALMVITPPEVVEGFAELTKDFKRSTSTTSIKDLEAYANGVREGKNSVSSRQIEVSL